MQPVSSVVYADNERQAAFLLVKIHGDAGDLEPRRGAGAPTVPRVHGPRASAVVRAGEHERATVRSCSRALPVSRSLHPDARLHAELQPVLVRPEQPSGVCG